jgi:AraC-like DNA-binding protein
MPARPPIFATADLRFVADSCAPLVAAAKSGLLRLSALARGHYPGRRLPGRALPGVCSVGYWDAPVPQPWHLDLHRNEGIELTYLEHGSLPFAVESDSRAAVRQHTLLPGTLTVTRPWQLHRVGAAPGLPPSRLHWVILDLGVRRPHQRWVWPKWVLLPPRDLARLTTLLSHCEQSVHGTPGGRRRGPDLSRCFADIARAVDRRDVTRLTLHLNELLVDLLEILQLRRSSLRPELASSRRTVELFLADLPRRIEQPWTVSAMADACALGRTRFTHIVQRLTNTTPLAHLTRLRLDRARGLLRDTDRAVTDIALSCGFGSSQYFATVFRRETGRSPRGYRSRPTRPPVPG